ncbi:MAG: hypothetical protein ACLUQ6_09950 [Alistipes onderdonkii]
MEKNLCRPGFALPLLMALLFAAAPAHAQELGIETVPSQPRALQEFEVWYTAGGEIESIEMPCWGSLTLVRELGRTSGTQTSVRDGVSDPFRNPCIPLPRPFCGRRRAGYSRNDGGCRRADVPLRRLAR